MRKRSYRRLGLLLALAAVGPSAGCSTSATTAVDTEYQNCVPGDACTGDTTCPPRNSPRAPERARCAPRAAYGVSDCPADPNVQDIDCVINAGETAGQCYIDCTSAGPADCEDLPRGSWPAIFDSVARRSADSR